MRTGRQESLSNHRTHLHPFLSAALGVAGCLIFLVAWSARGADSLAKLSYTKVLKGSVPEYLALTVASNGEATYEGRKLDEPSNPLAFRLSAATTQRLFELAAHLHNFQDIDLESHKKVANLGLKTLTYERDGEKSQAQFNYTQRRDAQELATLFEKVASVQQHLIGLERGIKYDHLSLPGELRQIQIDLENSALADPQLLVPALEKIERDPRFLHLARVRAQNILQRLQGSSQ